MKLASAPRINQRRPVIAPRIEAAFCEPAMLDDLLSGYFSVHGERHHLGVPVDWLTNPSGDVEWHIMLHKMYHAPALVRVGLDRHDPRCIALWQAHMTGWIDHVSPGFIAADVTGRRIQNWVYALSLYLGGGCPVIDWGFVERVEQSLREQTLWLRDNLHPSRNHRTLELLALLLGSVWLQSDEAAHEALDLLCANAEADFLPDGVHVELSSHYHCLVLRNLIEAVAVAEANGMIVPARLKAIVAKASRFARALHKPDGTIPMLGDADTGDYREMLADADAPRTFAHFPDAGFIFLRDQAAVSGATDGQYLVFDCGPLGAGNHGHLDCLSFEFAAFGRSLIVDPGRYTYFEGGKVNERAAFRGTAAHNLVQVNGQEQTAYRQGPKRMKIAGPSPEVAIIIATDGDIAARALSAQYDTLVERRIIRSEAGWWLVHDRMTSAARQDYDLRFQLAPDAQGQVTLTPIACGRLACLSPNLMLVPIGASELMLEQGWVAPTYGQRFAAPRLRCRQSGAGGWFATLMLPFASAPPPLSFTADADGYAISLDGQIWTGAWL